MSSDVAAEPPRSRSYEDRVGKIEQCGIDYIPESTRKSSPRNLFTILSGGSLTFSVIIIGWFPISANQSAA